MTLIATLVLIFGTRAVWSPPWPCGKFLSKSQVGIIHWRLLSVFVPFLYPCSHGPVKWACWCCSWPPCSSNNSPQVTDAKSTSHQFKNTYLWMDYIWPIWLVQTLSWVHGDLVPSSGNTRWTQWHRCLSGVYTKFPQYHWMPEIEPVDTCQCDHRRYCSYQEECKILPVSLSISHRPYCVSMMPNIPIGRCANQAWRDPRWTGRSSKGPCW